MRRYGNRCRHDDHVERFLQSRHQHLCGVRYAGMVDDQGRVVTTTQDFVGGCMGSWGDLIGFATARRS